MISRHNLGDQPDVVHQEPFGAWTKSAIARAHILHALSQAATVGKDRVIEYSGLVPLCSCFGRW